MNQKLTAGVFVLLGLLCVAARQAGCAMSRKRRGILPGPPKGWETKDHGKPVSDKIFVRARHQRGRVEPGPWSMKPTRASLPTTWPINQATCPRGLQGLQGNHVRRS